MNNNRQQQIEKIQTSITEIFDNFLEMPPAERLLLLVEMEARLADIPDGKAKEFCRKFVNSLKPYAEVKNG